MNQSSKHVIIVAGEASGDMHAAHLVEAIRKTNPHITFSGLGGPRMQASGVHLYTDLTRLAVVGFVEVIKHYKDIRGIFHLILKKIQETKADAVILVDYPGFNLRLACAIKKRKGTAPKVIYYISPQVWAWKENRVKAIEKYTDRMLVLFDFEKNFYARHHIPVDFVGHPLVDTVCIPSSPEEILPPPDRSKAESRHPLTIGILPGSRQKEIETIFPVMLEAATLLKQRNSSLQFLLFKAPSIDGRLLERFLNDHQSDGIYGSIKTIEDHRYHHISACDVCMVTSGTATLETAILNKPMVVVYKTSFLTWLLAKLLIKIPCIGLVNVVAGKKVVPECVQWEATGKGIAAELEDIYSHASRMNDIKSELQKVKQALGPPGASQRAAERILDIIGLQGLRIF